MVGFKIWKNREPSEVQQLLEGEISAELLPLAGRHHIWAKKGTVFHKQQRNGTANRLAFLTTPILS